MTHVLFAGKTMMGKTTLAVSLAQSYSDKGIPVAVLDPLMDPRWPADFITDDPDAFMEFFYNNEQCALFIDEAAEVVGHYDKTLFVTATKGRHFGHRAHYLTQRYGDLKNIIRSNCSTVFVFRLTKKESEAMDESLGHPDLRQAKNLDQGEYLVYHDLVKDDEPLEKRKAW